ncbi:MAG: hypothetical protein ACXWM7_02610 [Parachlamydiaceae bacterium]
MENSVPFTPVNFFQLSLDCHRLPNVKKGAFALHLKNYRQYLLPDTSALTGDDQFAEIALGWSVEGLEIFALIEESYTRSMYPQLEKGDSFELCIDTRDVKTSGYNTRFCHHFFFLPEAVDGRQAGELTKFRTEDAHELCPGHDLIVQSTLQVKTYLLQCFIPAHCLHGYDPEQFDRMGMTYRLNRAGDSSQHFSVIAEDYKFQEQPALWSSVRYVK